MGRFHCSYKTCVGTIVKYFGPFNGRTKFLEQYNILKLWSVSGKALVLLENYLLSGNTTQQNLHISFRWLAGVFSPSHMFEIAQSLSDMIYVLY